MMFDNQNDEEMERKIQDIERRHEALTRQSRRYLENLGITKEELEAYFSRSEHFDSEEWQQLQTLRKELEEKFQRDLLNIQNPKELKKKYSERNIPSHAIFVK